MSDPTYMLLPVESAANSCEVWVGQDFLERPGPAVRERLTEWLQDRTLFVISSPTVLGLHGHRLALFRELAGQTVFLTVPDGERAKSLAHADELWQAMLEAGGKRDSRLLTFGGGSVGDLGGFVAACFLRGIEYAQVPTTLLAQVDASLGGKTAVDVPQGKNLVGAFHQPRFVLSDTELLQTLPLGELRAGLVEALKKGALLDEGRLFEHIEHDLPRLLAGQIEALTPVIAEAARLKLDVVARDVREGGLRKVLNFGHTLAHAIEQQLGYEGLRHGEAVAYGILFAVRLAVRSGKLADSSPERCLSDRLPAILKQFELPPLPIDDMTLEGLLTAMGRDKKASRSGLTWVLPKGLGEFGLDDTFESSFLSAELTAFLDDPWAKVG